MESRPAQAGSARDSLFGAASGRSGAGMMVEIEVEARHRPRAVSRLDRPGVADGEDRRTDQNFVYLSSVPIDADETRDIRNMSELPRRRSANPARSALMRRWSGAPGPATSTRTRWCRSAPISAITPSGAALALVVPGSHS